MFKSFKTLPTESGYYLWKNFNPLFENNEGLNIFYLFDNSVAVLIGDKQLLHVDQFNVNDSWLGPYEFEFIKRKVKNPDVMVSIHEFQNHLL